MKWAFFTLGLGMVGLAVWQESMGASVAALMSFMAAATMHRDETGG